MTTIPSRLARATRASVDATDARHRTIQLYRDWYRSAPDVVELYALNVSPAAIRHAIRQRFEANRYVTDPRAIDVLLLKGRQEYQETVNCWKQTDHIMGILLQPQTRPQKTFLQRFYEGRDEQAVLPAASAQRIRQLETLFNGSFFNAAGPMSGRIMEMPGLDYQDHFETLVHRQTLAVVEEFAL
ncbi:hypothetical protein DXG01_001803 [Tephrocybe rancida]|nr:hypothetical protein DXG01_001803 [Tephrocybe rancida]